MMHAGGAVSPTVEEKQRVTHVRVLFTFGRKNDSSERE